MQRAAARPSRRPGPPQLFETRRDERRRHRVVRLEKAAREVQPDSLSRGQIDQDRSRVAAKRRAVVQHDVRPRLRHLARREPLLVVDVAEDRLHQLVVRNPPVPGGIPDHRDLLRRPGGRRRQRNRRLRARVRPRSSSTRRSAKSGPSSSSMWRISTIWNSSRSARPISSRKLIDAADRPRAAPFLEREAAARSAGRTPAPRDDWSAIVFFVHEPARAHVLEPREAGHVDAADGSRGTLQLIARCLQSRPPDLALAVGELDLRHAADDREHRPADAQHDIRSDSCEERRASREERLPPGSRSRRAPSAIAGVRRARISSASGSSAASSVEIRAFSHASRSLMPRVPGAATGTSAAR